MKYGRWAAIGAAGALLMMLGGVAHAQSAASADPSCPRTRAEVRAECVAFLKTHRWDEQVGDWVTTSGVKSGLKLPEGVTTREAIRAERDAFMRVNKWNDASAQWEPLKGAPRNVSALSRAEVLKETQVFVRTHQWDESLGTYVQRKGK